MKSGVVVRYTRFAQSFQSLGHLIHQPAGTVVNPYGIGDGDVDDAAIATFTPGLPHLAMGLAAIRWAFILS